MMKPLYRPEFVKEEFNKLGFPLDLVSLDTCLATLGGFQTQDTTSEGVEDETDIRILIMGTPHLVLSSGLRVFGDLVSRLMIGITGVIMRRQGVISIGPLTLQVGVE